MKTPVPESRFHWDYLLLFLSSVADFEHESQMFLFESLKYLSQETNIYSKLAIETLKQDVKSVKS